ncbi:ATP synthase subunit B [Desulfocurvibacter africanus]|uniref:ATP synthase subunit b n=1 Tax=Desulfocurvibacter africanus subsp. africanus str. Walvis Bay TaxID=690850 RepID=F3YUS0_DESAF|nr:ATP synthase subunit B [Desulfocurvibacter africanus]EGJ49097.1 ATP synthase subunit b [Desulfocurvibacter africanus subsp. africanus str. Walvis Bay]
MLIDWFTVGAQIINFLILIWLLKRLLYGPILRAMHEREERVRSRLEDARNTRREAEEELQRLQSERQELERAREEHMAQARREIKEWKDEAMDKAHAEVEEKRASWQQAVRQERERELEKMRKRIVGQVLTVSRRALADLADESLERKAADKFLSELRRRKAEDGDGFVHAGAVTLRIGGQVSEETGQRLRRELHEVFPEARNIEVSRDTDMGLGLTVVAGDRKWDWTLHGYLRDLEQEIFAVGAGETDNKVNSGGGFQTEAGGAG